MCRILHLHLFPQAPKTNYVSPTAHQQVLDVMVPIDVLFCLIILCCSRDTCSCHQSSYFEYLQLILPLLFHIAKYKVATERIDSALSCITESRNSLSLITSDVAPKEEKEAVEAAMLNIRGAIRLLQEANSSLIRPYTSGMK